MDELDELLESICARATALQHVDDPEGELRALLSPVRAFFVQHVRRESDGSVNGTTRTSSRTDPGPVRSLGAAAAKLQQMVLRSPASQRFSILRNRMKALSTSSPCDGKEEEDAATRSRSGTTLRGNEDEREAAIRIQALVRGSCQRQTFSRQQSLLVQGTKKYVLKTDRFPHRHVLPTPHGEVAPNFRRVEGTPLFGCAQPTLPFTARRSARLNANDLVPGITGHKVQILESSLKQSLQQALSAAAHRFEYWNEVAPGENELVVAHAAPDDVVMLPELYETLNVGPHGQARIERVVYRRLPIERENAPEQKHVEMLMNLIDGIRGDKTTAVVFNCQMGKRRTTTALVLGRLIYERDAFRVAASLRIPAGPQEHEPPTIEAGNFAVIRELQKRLPHGRAAKHWVDHAIDACATVCNLRTVIHDSLDRSNAEAKPAKRSYYLHHAMSYLERYFYLIVFGVYMMETHPAPHGGTDEPTTLAPTPRLSFSNWLQQHPDMFRLLDDLGGVRYKSDNVLATCVLKMDHFFGIARLPFHLSTNVPNYRRIANEPLFGTAQCLETGIRDVVDHLRGEFDRAIWINLREEAVIYVTGRPFCVRHGENLMVNVEYPGIEVDEINAIEHQVKRELQHKVQQDEGLFLYYYEPREMVNDETMEHINPHTDIKTLTEVYDDATHATHFDLRYARIPVSDETAPEEKDLDDMVRLLLPSFMNELGLKRADAPVEKQRKIAVICNCQMGRGRTTTALVCIYILRVVLEDSAVALASSSSTPSPLEQILNVRATDHRRHSAANTGDFIVMRKLVKTLVNGAESKLLVDYAIDQCDHMQNLRDCISQCRDLAVDRDLPSAKRDFFMLRAVNYLERYFYLVCFASYVLEERRHYFQRSLFVTWMKERYDSALYELLDNLCFEEEIGAETHVASMRWRWRRKRKLVSRLE
ncbi:hypothetical protein PsorP6_006652 [Peronosclerospora sorghi]|uniref:Uncharacterized protein n=1 Tax=Peronosclerospora sorghi TaxID=230839 RepID=A0ACC0W565_9STRA|nr:hypothetical protein PsorP6_006652 [Peronosclerospora sorghi]